MTTEFDRQRDIEAEGQRAAAYYARKGREADLPENLPELIVCRNEAHADRIRRQVRGHHHITVMSATSGLVPLLGKTYARVTVCEGVDLSADMGGEGHLGALLQKRQTTWGDRAVFVVL